MSPAVRRALFLVSGAAFLVVLMLGLHGLPPFGQHHSRLASGIEQRELRLRHATDYVTAINFDLRSFDTLGEESILFACVAGVMLLMRHMRQEDGAERRSSAEEHRFQGASDALRVQAVLMVTLLTAFGIYVDLHGALTPGGGFQAGVVLAAGPAAVMLAGRYLTLKRLAPQSAMEIFEAAGAAGYALIAVGGLVFAGVLFVNFLPYGTPGQLLSGGTMPLSSIAVGIEVTGGLLLIFSELLDQSLLATAED